MWPQAPPQTLDQLRTTLLAKIAQHFEHYTKERDEENATVFLGYFADMHAQQEGLAAYRRFACSFLESQADDLRRRMASPPSSPLFFAMVWASLWEQLAVFINQHQPIVDRLLHVPGEANFATSVLPGLSDVWTQIASDIVQAWRVHHHMDEQLSMIADTRTPVLESIRASPFTPGRIFGQKEKRGGSAAPSAAQSRASSPALHDTQHLDAILTELANMSSQWALFGQFLRRAMGLDAFAQVTSDVQTMMQNLLTSVFVPLQTYSLQMGVQKVHHLDTPDTSVRPYASSLPDDMFFALRAVLTRAFSTSDLRAVETIVQMALRMTEQDYLDIVVLRMDACRRALNVTRLVDGPRRIAAAREVRATMAVYVNALDTSAMYAERIQADLSENAFLEQYYDAEWEDGIFALTSAFALAGQLGTLAPKLRSALHFEIKELFAALIEPRLQTLVTDVFRDMRYDLNEKAYSDAEESDTVPTRLRHGWDTFMHGYRDQLSEANYAMLFSLAVDAIVHPWEKALQSLQFTDLGALRLDKDLRGVQAMLVEQLPWGVRDRFLRLMQTSYVLNMDEDDVRYACTDLQMETSDAYEEGLAAGVSWKLTATEVQEIRSRRISIA